MLFRKWAAIGTIAAALEQKVWIQTSGTLYPNLYVLLVGHPGVGKSRSITLAGQFLRQLKDFKIAPTSVTAAALVDFIVANPCNLPAIHHEGVTYNSTTILADELAAFTPEYSSEMIGLLTTMYDVVIPYGQKRRGKDLNLFVQRPQLNAIMGTTPSNLLKYMPDYAWDQGFTSRMILVYSNDRMLVDDIFKNRMPDLPKSMIHDLNVIRSLYGEFTIHTSYSEAFKKWRNGGYKPVPDHPRLTHYCTRRYAHLLKLSMVSSVDRGDNLVILDEDFDRAREWLIEAEGHMGLVFSEGYTSLDFKSQEELIHFIRSQDKGYGVPGDRIVREARRLMPVYAVTRTIDTLEQSGVIKMVGYNAKTNLKTYKFIGDS